MWSQLHTSSTLLMLTHAMPHRVGSHDFFQIKLRRKWSQLLSGRGQVEGLNTLSLTLTEPQQAGITELRLESNSTPIPTASGIPVAASDHDCTNNR